MFSFEIDSFSVVSLVRFFSIFPQLPSYHEAECYKSHLKLRNAIRLFGEFFWCRPVLIGGFELGLSQSDSNGRIMAADEYPARVTEPKLSGVLNFHA